MLDQQTKHQLGICALGVLSRTSLLLLGKALSLCFQRFDLSSSTSALRSPFKYLESWDTVHFISIAQKGYTHEHSLPFFPLVPLIARVLNFSDVLTTAVLVNNLAFVISPVVLYKISTLFFDARFSLAASIFFVFNPASIIFSVFYTESIFTLVFLLGFFYTVTGRHLKAALLFAICSACRSNAIFLILFNGLLYAPLVILPTALFQLYSLLLIARRNVSFRIFVPYSMVQVKYWGHGFLKFLTLQNLPNILIGLPVIILASFFLCEYYVLSMRGQVSTENDRQDTENENTSNTAEQQLHAVKKQLRVVKPPLNSFYFYDMLVFPRYETATSSHIVKLAGILAVQVATLICFVHWNIAMRFLAYNPFLYWSAAYYAMRHSKTAAFTRACAFFGVYGLLYVVMFSCFYPPP